MPSLRRLTLVALVAAAALAAFAVLSGSASAGVPAWTTYRHDAARSGIDPDSVNPVTPAQAWQTPALDGDLYAQPLVYGPYVYVATENDTVYELSAATGAVIWATHVGSPEPSSAAPCGDISPSIGITSTPVIDPATNRIYAVGAVSGADGVHHELFALDLGSGQPVAGFPIDVDPQFPAGGSAVNQLQRPGLVLDGGRILVGYGGNDGDCSTYWGWVVSAPENGSGPLNTFQVDAGHRAGAIWASGNAAPVDPSGNAFFATGNGIGNSSSDPEYGDAVVKLSPTGSPLDWWASPAWHSLDSGDLDLGSSMPILLPGGFLFEAGKDGNGYVLRSGALGNVSPAAAQASNFCPDGSFGGGVYDPANGHVYAACQDGLQSLSFAPGQTPSISADPAFSAPGDATGPPIIAAGLVWVTSYASGTLYGIDPTTGATGYQSAIPEASAPGGSDVNHFATASAAGGRLIVGSGDQVTAFTIATAPAPATTSTVLSASANPARAGRTVSLTATVSPTPYAGALTFTNDGATLRGCANIPVSAATGGRALCRAAFARVATHKLVAIYSGDQFDAGSRSPVIAEKVTHAPVISHVSLRPRRFIARRGARLRLTLNQAATVTVAITGLRRGHLSGGRCSIRAHRGKRCLARVTLLRLRFRGRKGRNSFKLRPARLAPGHYTALVFAGAKQSGRSATVRISFTLLRG